MALFSCAILSFIMCAIYRAKLSFWFMAWMVSPSRAGHLDLLISASPGSGTSMWHVLNKCVERRCTWRLLPLRERVASGRGDGCRPELGLSETELSAEGQGHLSSSAADSGVVLGRPVCRPQSGAVVNQRSEFLPPVTWRGLGEEWRSMPLWMGIPQGRMGYADEVLAQSDLSVRSPGHW